jgi:hypothetical protein
MAQTTTIILAPQTSFNGIGINNRLIGAAQPAAGYYLSTKDLQTVSWSFTSVSGVMSIQASLADTPSSDSDWFTVYSLALIPTVVNGIPATGNGTGFQNIQGNFTWIRAKIEGFNSGVVQNIKVTY